MTCLELAILNKDLTAVQTSIEKGCNVKSGMEKVGKYKLSRYLTNRSISIVCASDLMKFSSLVVMSLRNATCSGGTAIA